MSQLRPFLGDSMDGGLPVGSPEARAAIERVRERMNPGTPLLCPDCGRQVQRDYRKNSAYYCSNGCKWKTTRTGAKTWTIKV